MKGKKHVWKIFRYLVGGYLLLLVSFGPILLSRFGGKIPFQIQDLQVIGNRALQTGEVKMMAGIQEGQPLLGNWAKNVLSNIQTNPRISQVAVSRNLTGKVEIRVIERRAYALVHLGELYYTDREGNLLGKADSKSKDFAELVVITGPWSLGKKDIDKGRITQAIEILEVAARFGISNQVISEVHFDEKMGWILYRMNSRGRVVIGIGDIEKKISRLSYVLKDLKSKDAIVREIDLDFDQRVVVKLKEAT